MSTAGDPIARRTRYSVMSAVILTAITVSVFVLVVLSGRTHKRFDVTATRQYALSESSNQLIGSLAGDYEIVVSARLPELDPRARQRIADVLEEFALASERISVRWIDTTSATGQASFADLVASQLERQSDQVAAHTAAIEQAAQACETIASRTDTLSSMIKAIANALDQFDNRREQIEMVAAEVRSLSDRSTASAATTRGALANQTAGVPIPDLNAARESASPTLNALASYYQQLASDLDQLAGLVPQAAAASCDVAIREAGAQRDLAAGAADALERLAPLHILSIARVVEQQDTVIVVADTGLTAIDFATLFPPSLQIDANSVSQAELRFAGEQLIATAIGSLEDPVRPIVCFVHAEDATLFEDSGRPSPVARNAFGRLLNRFSLRQIDGAEWAVARSMDMPTFASLDPNRDRPVVWFVLGPPPAQLFDGSPGRSQADRVRIVERLAEATQRLATTGQNVLLCVDPSDRPAFGEKDPIVGCLEQFGVRSMNGAVVLRSQTSPYGPLIYTAHLLDTADTTSPIGSAIDALRTAIPWATAFTLENDAPVGTEVLLLLTIESAADTWSESQWIPFRYAQPANPLQPMLLANPPAPNPKRENTEGPWHVALTIERPLPDAATNTRGAATQRILAVGSPNWFTDAYVEAAERINGRRAWLFPGNAELLDSGLLWLTHRDHLIAASPRTRDIARIRPLTGGQLSAIRWGLILGLPASLLAIAGALRLIRG